VKIEIDRSQCQGHALCAAVDEDLFPLDEEGYSALPDSSDVPPGQEELARAGVASCPERALRLIE
jgi:ferredoxin